MTEETAGRRVRRTTQVFTIEQPKADDAETFAPPKGSGAVVGDMAFVGDQLRALGKKQVEMLRHLYGVLYGRRFQIKNMKVIKEHILQFSGIPVDEQDEKSREHLFFKIDRLKRNFLVEMMDLLAVDRFKKASEEEKAKSLDKKGLVNCLIDWLYNPQETKIAQRKAANVLKAEKRLERKRAQKAKAKDKKAKTAKKTTKRKAAAVEDEEEEEEPEDPEESGSEGDDSSSDFESNKGPKRRKLARRAKTNKSPIIESDDEGDENDEEQDASDAKEEVKDEAQPAAEPEAEETAESDVKPLSADVCDKVRDIIAHGNSDELTVKKIVRQLSEDMGRDMSSQKKAIKEFITGDQLV